MWQYKFRLTGNTDGPQAVVYEVNGCCIWRFRIGVQDLSRKIHQ